MSIAMAYYYARYYVFGINVMNRGSLISEQTGWLLVAIYGLALTGGSWYLAALHMIMALRP